MDRKFNREWFEQTSGNHAEGQADIFYVDEILFQCELALRSYGQMVETYKVHPRHPVLIALAHTLLVFSTNVAKLLDAPEKAENLKRKRVERLRRILDMEEVDFSFFRAARNYFEHFDERLDEYLQKTSISVVKQMVDDKDINKLTSDDGREFQPTFFKFFNTSTMQLTLYDKTYPLSDVLELMQRIKDSSENWYFQKTGFHSPYHVDDPSVQQ